MFLQQPRFEPKQLPVDADGFVDDAVVFELIAGSSRLRGTAHAADLVLPADDMDFAGWKMPELPAERIIRSPAISPEYVERQVPPPTLESPSRIASGGGKSRWWFAALIGTVSSLSLGLMLFLLSS